MGRRPSGARSPLRGACSESRPAPLAQASRRAIITTVRKAARSDGDYQYRTDRNFWSAIPYRFGPHGPGFRRPLSGGSVQRWGLGVGRRRVRRSRLAARRVVLGERRSRAALGGRSNHLARHARDGRARLDSETSCLHARLRRPQALRPGHKGSRVPADLPSGGCRRRSKIKEAGADFIVAQGTEAGGHGTEHASTLPLVPAVVDTVSPTPVLAAGGIADGRGLAAALMLGAQGALVGTRFYTSIEALGHERAKERILDARGDETKRTRVFDVARGAEWPEGYTGRALRNRFLERWDGREGELAAALDTEVPAFQEAMREGNTDTMMVWCGEAADL